MSEDHKTEDIEEIKQQLNEMLTEELKDNVQFQKAIHENPSVKENAEELQKELVSLFSHLHLALKEQQKK